MKALILAAGNGTRLRPLTDNVPKCLLPINGTPLLGIWLGLCAKHGITEVYVNVHANASAVKDFVQRYRGPVVIEVFEEQRLLGSAGTLSALRADFEDESHFWVMYGDVLTTVDLRAMFDHHLRSGCMATLGIHETPNPQECGIVSLNDRGLVYDFTEKPRHPQSNLAFSGIMIASPKIFDEIPNKVVCDIGYDLLPKLVNKMSAYRITDYLIDIGTIKAYKSAQRDWPQSADRLRAYVPAFRGAPC